MKTKKQSAPSSYSIATGGTIDGVQLGPLSAPAMALLKRRQNTLVVDSSDRDQDEIHALGEIMFVTTLSHEQRGNHFRTPASEWDELVSEFIAGLPDTAMEKFAAACAATKTRSRN